MVQIRRFQPRNVGGDLEQRFEHRNNAADDRGGNNPVADGKGALQSDHRPIICRGRKEIDRADKTEGEGQNPNRHPDAKPGANQFATTTYLQCQIDSGESTDHSGNEQRRVNFPKKNAAPKTDKNGGIEAVIAAEQDAQQERGKGKRGEQFRHVGLQAQDTAAAKDVDKFCERQLDQHHPEDEKNARVLRKSTRLIDPKHHQRNQEKEQRNDKILRWLGLVAAKDEHSQASNEGGEKDALHAPGIFQPAQQSVAGATAAQFSRSQAAADQFATFEKIDHYLRPEGVRCC